MKTKFLICICLSLISGISQGQDIKTTWRRILKSCNNSDTFGNESLFFGPSNTIGLGSVWRKTESNGYNPRFELQEMIVDSETQNKIIKLGEKTERCDAVKNVSWTSKIEVPFLGKIFNLNEGLAAELKKARRTTISVDNFALDVIKELPFEVAIKSILSHDPKNVYVADLLLNENRRIITKAYRLTGLVLNLDFDPKVLEELKTKYPNGASINLGGDKGFNVMLNYMSNSDLTVKLPNEVYIVGELSRVNKEGTINLNSSSTIKFNFVPVKVDTTYKIGTIEGLSKN